MIFKLTISNRRRPISLNFSIASATASTVVTQGGWRRNSVFKSSHTWTARLYNSACVTECTNPSSLFVNTDGCNSERSAAAVRSYKNGTYLLLVATGEAMYYVSVKSANLQTGKTKFALGETESYWDHGHIEGSVLKWRNRNWRKLWLLRATWSVN